MAIVSISRIQIRRGRKNEGSGLPQLASGEFAWAVDTQELYIGNGSVAEGSPFVGNTKVLTEKDNILEFASLYEYKRDLGYIQTGEFANSPIRRSLQDRLDDFVSIKSFGANGDATDQTAEIQRAIYQLFLNPSAQFNLQSRAVLHLNAGEYVISDTIYIPPFCVIRGAGPEKTVIRKRTAGPAFQTISSLSTVTNPISLPGVDNNTQARNISIDGFTLTLENGANGFDIKGCRDSRFSNIKMSGNWIAGSNVDVNSWGIYFESSDTVNVSNNEFDNLEISDFSYALYSPYDIRELKIDSSKFYNLGKGIVLGSTENIAGQVDGALNNIVSNSTFDKIKEESIEIVKGNNNLSTQNKFYAVGCWNGTNSAFEINFPQHPIIKFPVDSQGNNSKKDWFERTEKVGKVQGSFVLQTGLIYLPEISGPSFNDISFSSLKTNLQTGIDEELLNLPADVSRTIEVEYIWIVYNSTDRNTRLPLATRKGTLEIILNVKPDSNGILQSQKMLVDNYQAVGGETYLEELEFVGEFTPSTIDNVRSFKLLTRIENNQINSDIHYKIKTVS